MASPLSPHIALANLQATALAARCHNAFFRQQQLKFLHDVLRNNVSAIKDAIKSDTHVSDVEASTEVALALNVVKEHYSAINPKKELEEEYRIAHGKNAENSTKPWDVAYIEPQRNHTPFFSAIVALSAAVAAGSCVALKIENNLRQLPSLLRKILPEALEADTFAIVSSDPSAESLSECLQVTQESTVSTPTFSQLASSQGKVVAIVDRTANLAQAAEQLVTARFAFGGSSPYAPDVVLVNEFVKKEFLEQVLQHAIRFLSGANDITTNGSANGSAKSPGQKTSSALSQAFTELQNSKSWKLNVVTRGDSGAIVELSNLSSLPAKVSQPIFAIAPITSLELALNLVDEELSPQESLLAAYFFGTPGTGKYLSQFISSEVSFTNHLPFRLLLGPAAPAFQPIDVEKRYTTRHFRRATPAYVTLPASQASISKVIAGKDSRKAAADLLAAASTEIKEAKRKEAIALGYFEQGILIGLSIYGIPILTCIGASLFFGVRAGLRRWVFV